MLKTPLLTLLVLVIAIGGGAGSLSAFLETASPVGAVGAGPWTAFPDAGTPQADPYSRARFAREGGIPLGRSEGIVFTAVRDSAGQALSRDCTYRVQGPVPGARLWTLHATDATGKPLPPLGRRISALHSQMILRRPDQPLTITVSPHPEPDNWLAVTGAGAMHLVLTLLDTPVSAGLQLTELALPQIVRVGCDA
ncbi:DUF1214 domain-containing protein [Chelativorans sp. AA-79]|uniref:DUF1214 domain-containing protein n=1 Tax=Chelativorans sp. AA-79 TaxID=3028735 RepID=UPI0023F69E8F|nr:DUF1214 domain-containing protein [Chelativorans sp. AA-79]WEX07741.1 DUF1214 domain-containing protein [Chelativorans sp. AA-79]